MAAEKAEYLIKEPAQVGDEYFHATREDPTVIKLAAGTEPSSKWIPLNATAKADLKKLLDYRKKPQDEKEAEAQKRLEEEHLKEAEEIKARSEANKEAEEAENRPQHGRPGKEARAPGAKTSSSPI